MTVYCCAAEAALKLPPLAKKTTAACAVCSVHVWVTAGQPVDARAAAA
jgi:uncharacterized paraquat-inducible protein A